MTSPNPFPREAVGVFHDAEGMQSAIDELLSSGFDRSEISVLAGEKAFAEHPDLAWRSSRDLEDEPGTPSTSYVSPESLGDAQGALIGVLAYVGAAATAAFTVGAGGPIGGAIVASAIAGGVGGGIGAVLGQILKHRQAITLSDELVRGGLLLWVRTRDSAREERAVEILRKHGGGDVHVHDIVPESVWRGTVTDHDTKS
ncbi:hypothetical protein DK867_21260 [Ochrobactrum sp. POC9]|uniref:hypothetical protein n=1 Tax=Ochrobactrum sp. POC9 TaxID=2203419 RepID=UPI000D7062E3|nr:hypothetical protein [Ochrobactrum sp. POC9]PWU71072.1 hypothetical protein DK867_21260 [Ochrobactrum sp. POC9]